MKKEYSKVNIIILISMIWINKMSKTGKLFH